MVSSTVVLMMIVSRCTQCCVSESGKGSGGAGVEYDGHVIGRN